MKPLKLQRTRLVACALGAGLLAPMAQQAFAQGGTCPTGYYLVYTKTRVQWLCQDDPGDCNGDLVPLLDNMTYKKSAQMATCYWDSAVQGSYRGVGAYAVQFVRCFGPNRYQQDCCEADPPEKPCPLPDAFDGWGEAEA